MRQNGVACRADSKTRSQWRCLFARRSVRPFMTHASWGSPGAFLFAVSSGHRRTLRAGGRKEREPAFITGEGAGRLRFKVDSNFCFPDDEGTARTCFDVTRLWLFPCSRWVLLAEDDIVKNSVWVRPLLHHCRSRRYAKLWKPLPWTVAVLAHGYWSHRNWEQTYQLVVVGQIGEAYYTKRGSAWHCAWSALWYCFDLCRRWLRTNSPKRIQ